MKAGKIRRSIQRFEDYSRDLISSDMNSFEDRLNLLISYCKSDAFFQKIDEQLVYNKSVTFDRSILFSNKFFGGKVCLIITLLGLLL